MIAVLRVVFSSIDFIVNDLLCRDDVELLISDHGSARLSRNIEGQEVGARIGHFRRSPSAGEKTPIS